MQEIEFFVFLANSNPPRQKSKEQIVQTIKNIQSGVFSPADSNVSVNIVSQNSIKNLDLNIFGTLNQGKMQGLNYDKKQENKKSKEGLR